MRRLILVLAMFVTACSPSTITPATTAADPLAAQPVTPTPVADDQQPRGTITVPLTLHVVVEQGAADSELSSRRTVDDVTEIASRMSGIWAQADVVFEPIVVNQLEIPQSVLQGIALGDTSNFFAQVNQTFVPQDAQAINGFYVRSAFGVNGFTPQGSNLFFVVDEPSVHDERVSSHEVGHIFGLRHDLNDAGQLMFSGTNGTGLSELEQTVARYSIQGLFPQGVEP